MERLTLRDAAERTGMSVTTLRRYIRSGKLPADKTPGRYGPEYTVATDALLAAGMRFDPTAPLPIAAPANGAIEHAGSRALAPAPAPAQPPTFARGAGLPESLLRELIPIDLFRELSMKHEQLLVQYGMVRVGGQKMLEYKAEAERLADSLKEIEAGARTDRERYAREVGYLKKHMREAELEIEAKNQDVAALREKVRMLELLSRNAITSESIERQFLQVFEKRREVDELSPSPSDERRRKMAALDEILNSGTPRKPEEPTDQ